MFGPRCSALGPRCLALGVWPSVFGPRCSALGVQPSALGVLPSVFGPRCSALGPRCLALGVWPSVFGPRPSVFLWPSLHGPCTRPSGQPSAWPSVQPKCELGHLIVTLGIISKLKDAKKDEIISSGGGRGLALISFPFRLLLYFWHHNKLISWPSRISPISK